MYSFRSMVTISIITPSYNQAKFLKRTLDSVHSQQGEFRLEHIVVDGGSDDGTVELLKSYGDAIKWISQSDEGQADALNKGIAMAGGDIIGWLNSDDIYEPGCLATVAKTFADEPQTQWLYGKVRIINSDDREIRKLITLYKNLRMRRWSYRKLLAENWISQMGVFWRREAGRQIGPFRKDLHYCMDYNYWLRLGKKWPGRFVDEYLAAFRVHSTSKSTTSFRKQFREELDVAMEIASGRYRLTMAIHYLNYLKIVTVYTARQLLGG